MQYSKFETRFISSKNIYCFKRTLTEYRTYPFSMLNNNYLYVCKISLNRIKVNRVDIIKYKETYSNEKRTSAFYANEQFILKGLLRHIYVHDIP